jgi:hypothetical protein
MAVCIHASLLITAFTMSVTQFWAKHVENGGWSDSSKRGVTQVTAGSLLASMSAMS